MNNNGMSFPICQSCGFAHPPIALGSKCPMAKDKTPSGNVIEFDEFFLSLKNILTSQIKNKDVKDIKKYLGNILVNITKISEGYVE
jgi:hypothetical protein